MTTVTIPKELSGNKDLVAVPKGTYEEFLGWLKKAKSLKTFKPNKKDLAALARGRKNFKSGNYVTLEQLENELASSICF